MGRGCFESEPFKQAADAFDREVLDQCVLFPVTWSLRNNAETYPLVPDTPKWRVIKIDPRPHFKPCRIYFSIETENNCCPEELQVDVDVYGEEDSS